MEKIIAGHKKVPAQWAEPREIVRFIDAISYVNYLFETTDLYQYDLGANTSSEGTRVEHCTYPTNAISIKGPIDTRMENKPIITKLKTPRTIQFLHLQSQCETDRWKINSPSYLDGSPVCFSKTCSRSVSFGLERSCNPSPSSFSKLSTFVSSSALSASLSS